MYQNNSTITYSPSDLTTYIASQFASWMDHLSVRACFRTARDPNLLISIFPSLAKVSIIESRVDSTACFDCDSLKRNLLARVSIISDLLTDLFIGEHISAVKLLRHSVKFILDHAAVVCAGIYINK